MKARIAGDQYCQQASQMVADENDNKMLGWLESLIVMGACLVLKTYHNFGAKTRIPEFAARFYESIDIFNKTSPDDWEDYIRNECLSVGATPNEKEFAVRRKVRAKITDKEKAIKAYRMVYEHRLGSMSQYKKDMERKEVQERSFIIKALLAMSEVILVRHFGFAPEKAMYFGGGVIGAVQEYGDFDLGEWPHLMKKALEENGVLFENDWISPRQYGKLPILTKAQEEVKNENWGWFFTDKELKERERYKGHLTDFYRDERKQAKNAE